MMNAGVLFLYTKNKKAAGHFLQWGPAAFFRNETDFGPYAFSGNS